MNDTLQVLGPSVLPTAITPDTLVVAGHRGGPPLLELFDGQKWKIPAGQEFLIPYGVALALRRRAIVPGSRDRHSGIGGQALRQKSYLYIKGTADGRRVPEADKPEDCRPFTTAELQRYGMAKEAIAREPGEVRLVDTTDVQAAILSSGIDLDVAAQAPVDPAVLAPIPADQHPGLQDARAIASEQGDTLAPRGGRRR